MHVKKVLCSIQRKIHCDFCGRIIVYFIMSVQLILIFLTQIQAVVNTDGIFSYTLANNPYDYCFIDAKYDEFPQNNGWIDAQILRENYVVEKYDRFNYAAVYHHQRYDVHPPLYYYLVHTISSLFWGRYSILYTMVINLTALFVVDLLVIKLFGDIYHKKEYAAVPLMFLLLMDVMQFLYTWARMYMMLFVFCLWYLYIHWHLIKQKGFWKKTCLAQMILCIFFGTLTHYYFYVYAASLTFLMIVFLVCEQRRHELFSYIYAGIIGIASSWIFFPWVIWHVFFNQQNKHADIIPWSLKKLESYFTFCNEKLFNGRIWMAAIVLAVLYMGIIILRKGRRNSEDGNHSMFVWMTLGSGILYSLIIYTLDGGVAHYLTAFYMTFIIWCSMLLIDCIKNINISQKKDALTIMAAVICVVLICSTKVVENYITNAGNVVSRTKNHVSLKNDFFRVSEDHKSYDCIFVEKEKNNLLQNYWFEFGEYDEFKKISIEDYSQYGISEEDLNGRKTLGGVVVYAPREYLLDGENCRLLAGDGSYNIYELVNEEK